MSAAACSSGSGSGRTAATTTPRRLHVVATTPILGELVEAVVGDRADVSVLMSRTDDPRTFVAPGDTEPLASADVIVAVDPATYEVGLAPAIDARTSAGEGPDASAADGAGAGPQLVIATEVLDARRLDGTPDPHVWLDPDRFTTLAREVARVLAAASGTDPGAWSDAAEAYGAQLALADEQVQAALAPLTPTPHHLLQPDDRLGYFADRYGLVLELLPPNVDANVLVIDVDRLGPAGSDTGTVAGLLTSVAHRIAAWR